jgi:hypothetical protein
MQPTRVSIQFLTFGRMGTRLGDWLITYGI